MAPRSAITAPVTSGPSRSPTTRPRHDRRSPAAKPQWDHGPPRATPKPRRPHPPRPPGHEPTANAPRPRLLPGPSRPPTCHRRSGGARRRPHPEGKPGLTRSEAERRLLALLRESRATADAHEHPPPRPRSRRPLRTPATRHRDRRLRLPPHSGPGPPRPRPRRDAPGQRLSRAPRRLASDHPGARSPDRQHREGPRPPRGSAPASRVVPRPRMSSWACLASASG